MLKSILVLVSFFLSGITYSQSQCKVLIPELQGNYTGKCKKGLAHGHGKAVGEDTYEGNFRKGYPHGEGIYMWGSGEKYEGRWKMGLRDGEGIYTFQKNGHDTIQEGIWKDNEYKGKKPKPPKVVHNEYVTRYSFRREGDGNRIFIDLKLNGNINRDILDLTVGTTSGSTFENGRSIGVETMVFPVTIKLRYITWNTAHTSRHTCSFEFIIYEPGNWQVDITN